MQCILKVCLELVCSLEFGHNSTTAFPSRTVRGSLLRGSRGSFGVMLGLLCLPCNCQPEVGTVNWKWTRRRDWCGCYFIAIKKVFSSGEISMRKCIVCGLKILSYDYFKHVTTALYYLYKFFLIKKLALDTDKSKNTIIT